MAQYKNKPSQNVIDARTDAGRMMQQADQYTPKQYGDSSQWTGQDWQTITGYKDDPGSYTTEAISKRWQAQVGHSDAGPYSSDLGSNKIKTAKNILKSFVYK